ncbi:Poly-gamma-glutamate synthase subunit PgsC/CapC [Clostridiaceae bacterium JG1575]|nr:Poly-gamma-glutamate synthase subunit PgsC/CapC [Clostridiaceae bacterium JG1575]
MFGTDFYLALVVGIIISLIYSDLTGISPAGLVVPGYLALIFQQPLFLAVIFLLSFLTYLIVVQGIGRVTILYGKRKFAAMLTVGLFLKLLFDYFYPIVPFNVQELRGIGVIVPGLLANSIQREGFVLTVTSTLLITAVTYLILLGYALVF